MRDGNADALLEAAKAVFARSGVDAPAKEIADAAGVGVATLCRHSLTVPTSSCRCSSERSTPARRGPGAGREEPAGVALEKWLYRLTEFVATKQGLAAALHSGDPAFNDLPALFMGRFVPALEELLSAATASGDVRVPWSSPALLDI